MIVALASLLLLATPPLPTQSAVASDKDYPGDARRREIQGDVGYIVEVDSAGLPTSCRVRSPSGSDLLDRAACKTVMRWRFVPARNDQGEPVAGQISDWMSFNLWDGIPIKATGYSVDVLFDKSGRVTACRVNRITPGSRVAKVDLNLCETMADGEAFAAYLGRPTAGLQRASIRTYTLANPRYVIEGAHDLVRRLAAVELGVTDAGKITRCRMILPAVAPVSAPGGNFCALEPFKVTMPSGGKPKLFVIDAVATLAR